MKENLEKSTKKYQKFWDRVDENLSEGDYSGYKMAVIETEKILSMVLSDQKFSGKNIDAKIENAKIILKNYEKLNYSRSMYKKIIQEPEFDISEDDTKEILTGYYNSISDINNIKRKDLTKKEKLGLFLQKYLGDFPKKSKKVVLATTVFFLLIFALSETSTGNTIVLAVVNFTKFLFYTVLFSILKILVVLVIVIGLLYYWKNKKDK